MDGPEFFKTSIRVYHHGLSFYNFVLYVHFRDFFEFLWLFFDVICLFGLSVMLFLFSYFTPTFIFCFLCNGCLLCLRAFSIYFLVQFSFVLLECPILFAVLNSISLSFKSPFFRQYLLIYLFKLHCQTRQVFCFVFFIPIYMWVFFLSLTISLVVTVYLFDLLVEFPIKDLYFCSGCLGQYWFYLASLRLVSLLHELLYFS